MPIDVVLVGRESVMSSSTPTTVLVAQFEDLLARGLRSVIDADASVVVVAEDVAHDRVDVVMRVHRPQVAILDADRLRNLAQVRELVARHPQTHLIVFTGHPTAAEGAQILAFGASACLGRDTQARDVMSAIHLASRGLQLLPRRPLETSPAPAPGSHLLTPREAELVVMLKDGSSNAEIAAALQVGVETVRTHARSIYRKLGVSSRLQLTEPGAAAPVPAVSLAHAARPADESFSLTRPCR